MRPGLGTDLKARCIRESSGFTLPEVMIALLLISGMCFSVFAGLNTMSKWTLHTAIRSEAHRLMQQEAERLVAASYANFVSKTNETITSSVNTTFRPGAQPQFSYPGNNSGARVNFTRRVVETASSDTSRTLRVEVEWSWQSQDYAISCRLFRVQ